MDRSLKCVLAIVAVLLLLSIDHGLPHRYVPDDTTVRCALGIAKDLTSGEVPLLEALFPPEDRYTTYPMLLPWLDLGAVGVRFGVGLALGDWTGPGSFKAAVFEDPGVAWLPARILSALLALLVPLGVAGAARELGRSRGEAAISALAGGSALLLVQYAHTSRPWAPMLGFGALTLWLSLRMITRRRVRDVVLPFVAAGLAGASFQVGLMMVGLPIGALVVAAVRPGVVGRAGLGRGALVGVLAAALVLCGLGYPHVLLHGAGQGTGHGDEATTAQRDEASVSLGGQEFDLSKFGGARAADVSLSWAASEPLLAVAGTIGLLLLGVVSGSLGCWLLVVAPGLALVTAFTLYDGTHVRYLMSATPFLALGAGALLSALARRGGIARTVAVLMLCVPLVQASRLDMLLGRADTRTLAASELPSLVAVETRVAVDGMGSRYGPPLLPRADALREVAAQGVWLGRLEQQVVDFADAGMPASDAARELLPIQRFWRFDSYYATDFLYDGLSVAQHEAAGTTAAKDGTPIEAVSLDAWMTRWSVGAYCQVDRLPDMQRREPIAALTKERGRLLAEWSPTGSTSPVRAELPTDMAFPLIDLWTYERPGPWIQLWELSP